MKYWYMDIKVSENTTVVFDLDDTLYNELDFLKSAYISIAKELDPKGWQQLYVLMFSLYRNNKDVFEVISTKYGHNKTLLIQMYRDHTPNITLFKGVLDTIKAILAKNGKVGILTDGRSHTQRNKIKALGLNDFVDFIVISEEVGSEKPNPNNFKIIEAKSNSEVHYYIGDNLKKDFIAPNTLGWKTICLIDSGLNIHNDGYRHLTKQQTPQHYIFAIEELDII